MTLNQLRAFLQAALLGSFSVGLYILEFNGYRVLSAGGGRVRPVLFTVRKRSDTTWSLR